MEPILACRNFWNKYLIINHSNRMNFGTHEWQERVRVNYFKDLDLKLSCNEQWLRTIQVAPPVKALIEMTQHRQDRGRIRILFSIATFSSLGYEAILFSAQIVWYFLWSLLCPLKVFLATAVTKLLGNTYCSSWPSADYVLYPPESLLGFFVFYLSPFGPFH